MVNFNLIIPAVKTSEKSKFPYTKREGDACMDCYASKEVTIPGFKPLEGLGRAMVPLGFKMKLPEGWEAQVRPRSGMAINDGLTILNTPGTVDENYTGEVCAIVLNTTAKDYIVKEGDRICQLAIRPTGLLNTEVVFKEVEELEETNRGEAGFGSSGK